MVKKQIEKEIKAPKQAWSIKVSTLIISLVLISIGIAIGVLSTNTVNSVIKHETQSQVKSFTSK